MPLKRCDAGHYYRPEGNPACPYCNGHRAGPATDPGQAATRPARATPPEAARPGTLPAIAYDPVVGWLVAVRGAGRGSDFRIRVGRNSIGRAPGNGIVVPGDPEISGTAHAIVSFEPRSQSFKIAPGESRGITYLNGAEVSTSQELKGHDRIEIGRTELLFVPLCDERFRWEDADEEA